MTKQPTVSVIIPMYNVAGVMNDCLHALLRQDLADVELVFVDDCSRDDTVPRLTQWMERHADAGFSFTLVRHSENQGVAAARNSGLDRARGKYVYYVDADDHVEPQTLRTLYEAAERTGADITGCEWFLSFATNERSMPQADATTGRELFERLTEGVMRWNLWLFLVRRSLYEENALRFTPRMNMGEDMMMMLKLALCADRVTVCHRPLYHYLQTNSASLTKNYRKSIPQITANIAEVERYLHQTGRDELLTHLRLLQLNVKLPLLISPRADDYRLWLEWFSEANDYIEQNRRQSLRTRLLQKAARARRFWMVRWYYYIVIKVIYGLIYK